MDDWHLLSRVSMRMKQDNQANSYKNVRHVLQGKKNVDAIIIVVVVNSVKKHIYFTNNDPYF